MIVLDQGVFMCQRILLSIQDTEKYLRELWVWSSCIWVKNLVLCIYFSIFIIVLKKIAFTHKIVTCGTKCLHFCCYVFLCIYLWVNWIHWHTIDMKKTCNVYRTTNLRIIFLSGSRSDVARVGNRPVINDRLLALPHNIKAQKTLKRFEFITRTMK